MSEEFLDGPDGVALLEEMRRETMAKSLAADVFIEPHRTTGLAHSLLQTALTRMMTTNDSCVRVFRQPV
jgi:hypothetical protein